MARPISMVSVALVTAAASGLLPQLAPRLSLSPSTNPAISPTVPAPIAPTLGSSLPGATIPLSTGGSVKSLGTNIGLVVPVQPLRFEWRDRAVSRSILFMNDGAIPYKVTLDVILQDRLGREQKVAAGIIVRGRLGRSVPPAVVTPPTFDIGMFSDKIVDLMLWFPCKGESSTHSVIPSALPATGFLKISLIPKQGNTTSAEQGIVIPEPPTPGLAGEVFAGSLVMAVLIVLITLARFKFDPRILLGPMANPVWVQQSWGTNVTIAAGLLGILLRLSLFPEHPSFMASTSYNLLLSLFAVIVGLAPLMYGLIRRDGQDAATAGATAQGHILTFIIAGGIILWGALGQALTLSLMIAEFIHGNTIDELAGDVVEGLSWVIVGVLVAYGLRSLYMTAKRADESAVAMQGKQLAPNQALPAHLAPWPLL